MALRLKWDKLKVCKKKTTYTAAGDEKIHFALVRKGDSGSMENIVFLEPNKIDSEPFTTSKVIAETTGMNHRRVKDAIRKHQADIESF